jgi:hypothetical protein
MTTLWLCRGLIVAVLPELFPATISLAQPQLCDSQQRRRLVAILLATIAHGIANLTAPRSNSRHAFLRPPQHPCRVATALGPLQDSRDYTEYVRRIAGVSPPRVHM